MSIKNNGDLTVLGSISSPTINLKANIASPTFTGIVTTPALITPSIKPAVTGGTLAVSGNIITMDSTNYITMQGGQVYIDDFGNILSNSYSDNTSTTIIDSTGISTNNVIITNSLTIPIQPSKGIYTRAFCTIVCSGGTYSQSYGNGFRTFPSTGTDVFKIGTGIITLLVDKNSGINDPRFMVQMSGSYDNGTNGASGLIFQLSTKTAYYSSSVLIGYSFTLIISKTSNAASPVDISNTGSFDVMVSW
jgi:hypothetical protein